MNSAKVSLEIWCKSSTPPTPPMRTQCGVARSFPAVASSSASPVWKARQSGGIETFFKSPPRVRIYRPDVGEGDGTNIGWLSASARTYIAYRTYERAQHVCGAIHSLNRGQSTESGRYENHTSYRLAHHRYHLRVVHRETAGSSGEAVPLSSSTGG